MLLYLVYHILHCEGMAVVSHFATTFTIRVVVNPNVATKNIPSIHQTKLNNLSNFLSHLGTCFPLYSSTFSSTTLICSVCTAICVNAGSNFSSNLSNLFNILSTSSGGMNYVLSLYFYCYINIVTACSSRTYLRNSPGQ